MDVARRRKLLEMRRRRSSANSTCSSSVNGGDDTSSIGGYPPSLNCGERVNYDCSSNGTSLHSRSSQMHNRSDRNYNDSKRQAYRGDSTSTQVRQLTGCDQSRDSAVTSAPPIPVDNSYVHCASESFHPVMMALGPRPLQPRDENCSQVFQTSSKSNMFPPFEQQYGMAPYQCSSSYFQSEIPNDCYHASTNTNVGGSYEDGRMNSYDHPSHYNYNPPTVAYAAAPTPTDQICPPGERDRSNTEVSHYSLSARQTNRRNVLDSQRRVSHNLAQNDDQRQHPESLAGHPLPRFLNVIADATSNQNIPPQALQNFRATFSSDPSNRGAIDGAYMRQGQLQGQQRQPQQRSSIVSSISHGDNTIVLRHEQHSILMTQSVLSSSDAEFDPHGHEAWETPKRLIALQRPHIGKAMGISGDKGRGKRNSELAKNSKISTSGAMAAAEDNGGIKITNTNDESIVKANVSNEKEFVGKYDEDEAGSIGNGVIFRSKQPALKAARPNPLKASQGDYCDDDRMESPSPNIHKRTDERVYRQIRKKKHQRQQQCDNETTDENTCSGGKHRPNTYDKRVADGPNEEANNSIVRESQDRCRKPRNESQNEVESDNDTGKRLKQHASADSSSMDSFFSSKAMSVKMSPPRTLTGTEDAKGTETELQETVTEDELPDDDDQGKVCHNSMYMSTTWSGEEDGENLESSFDKTIEKSRRPSRESSGLGSLALSSPFGITSSGTLVGASFTPDSENFNNITTCQASWESFNFGGNQNTAADMMDGTTNNKSMMHSAGAKIRDVCGEGSHPPSPSLSLSLCEEFAAAEDAGFTTFQNDGEKSTFKHACPEVELSMTKTAGVTQQHQKPPPSPLSVLVIQGENHSTLTTANMQSLNMLYPMQQRSVSTNTGNVVGVAASSGLFSDQSTYVSSSSSEHSLGSSQFGHHSDIASDEEDDDSDDNTLQSNEIENSSSTEQAGRLNAEIKSMIKFKQSGSIVKREMMSTPLDDTVTYSDSSAEPPPPPTTDPPLSPSISSGDDGTASSTSARLDDSQKRRECDNVSVGNDNQKDASPKDVIQEVGRQKLISEKALHQMPTVSPPKLAFGRDSDKVDKKLGGSRSHVDGKRLDTTNQTSGRSGVSCRTKKECTDINSAISSSSSSSISASDCTSSSGDGDSSTTQIELNEEDFEYINLTMTRSTDTQISKSSQLHNAHLTANHASPHPPALYWDSKYSPRSDSGSPLPQHQQWLSQQLCQSNGQYYQPGVEVHGGKLLLANRARRAGSDSNVLLRCRINSADSHCSSSIISNNSNEKMGTCQNSHRRYRSEADVMLGVQNCGAAKGSCLQSFGHPLQVKHSLKNSDKGTSNSAVGCSQRLRPSEDNSGSAPIEEIFVSNSMVKNWTNNRSRNSHNRSRSLNSIGVGSVQIPGIPKPAAALVSILGANHVRRKSAAGQMPSLAEITCGKGGLSLELTDKSDEVLSEKERIRSSTWSHPVPSVVTKDALSTKLSPNKESKNRWLSRPLQTSTLLPVGEIIHHISSQDGGTEILSPMTSDEEQHARLRLSSLSTTVTITPNSVTDRTFFARDRTRTATDDFLDCPSRDCDENPTILMQNCGTLPSSWKTQALIQLKRSGFFIRKLSVQGVERNAQFDPFLQGTLAGLLIALAAFVLFVACIGGAMRADALRHSSLIGNLMPIISRRAHRVLISFLVYVALRDWMSCLVLLYAVQVMELAFSLRAGCFGREFSVFYVHDHAISLLLHGVVGVSWGRLFVKSWKFPFLWDDIFDRFWNTGLEVRLRPQRMSEDFVIESENNESTKQKSEIVVSLACIANRCGLTVASFGYITGCISVGMMSQSDKETSLLSSDIKSYLISSLLFVLYSSLGILFGWKAFVTLISWQGYNSAFIDRSKASTEMRCERIELSPWSPSSLHVHELTLIVMLHGTFWLIATARFEGYWTDVIFVSLTFLATWLGGLLKSRLWNVSESAMVLDGGKVPIKVTEGGESIRSDNTKLSYGLCLKSILACLSAFCCWTTCWNHSNESVTKHTTTAAV